MAGSYDIDSAVPLHLQPQYRVFVDFYKPSQAAPLLRALVGLDDESAEMTVRLWAMEAVRELGEQVN